MELNNELLKNLQVDTNASYKGLNVASQLLQLKQALGTNWFFEMYDENNLEGPQWQLIEFGFSASNVQISNDSANVLLFSWDGNKVDGVLYAGEALPFNQIERNKIYLKSHGKIRLWAIG